MKPAASWILGCLVACTIVCAAAASERYFPDCSEVSPDGRFRVDAKSPENVGQTWGAPFAANFVYTLTDTRTGQILWTRPQPMRRDKGKWWARPAEGSPMRLHIDNTGIVAAYVWGEAVVFLDGRTGRKIGEVDLLRGMPQEQQRRHIRSTTAGLQWTWNSRWSFLRLADAGGKDERLLFVVRPHWGYRLVMDAQAGQLIDVGEFAGCLNDGDLAAAPADIARLMRAVLNAERAWTTTHLEGVTKDEAALKSLLRPEMYAKLVEVCCASHVAGQLGVARAVPSLRLLEAAMAEKARTSDPESLRDAILTLRNIRLALRRLGEIPGAGCGVELRLPEHQPEALSVVGDTRSLQLWVPVEERVMNAHKVIAGMSLRELAELIGCPDARAPKEPWKTYDYDIDAEPAYTLRVSIDPAANVIERVERITPAVWKDPTARGGESW
jgi:hypothetical protein